MAAGVVLVHGAMHGSWCWEPTIPYLAGRVLAVDLPPASVRGGPGRHTRVPELETLTVDDFAQAVLAAVDRAALDRFVLVGHSLGGVTITDVATRVPDRVAHLVYVAATVPRDGESVLASVGLDAESARRIETAEPAPFSEAAARSMFANDFDEAQVEFLLARLGLETKLPTIAPVERARPPAEVAQTYIKLLRDETISPARQDGLIANLRAFGGDVTVVEIDAGHDVMISAPRELAAVINDVAAEALFHSSGNSSTSPA